MATVPKHPPSRKPPKRPSAEKLARDLGEMVDKTFSRMSPTERVKKHEEFISLLKGRRS
jgi:hypothetical protein